LSWKQEIFSNGNHRKKRNYSSEEWYAALHISTKKIMNIKIPQKRIK
jgi:hypothetical protein